jgi:6-phosphogluconolactonase (cycloisomerase 2 family)
MAIDSATGALSNVPGSPFATNLFPTTLAADPSGRFLYMAVFGDSEIQGFNVDATSGGLTEMAGSPFSSPVTANSLVVNSAGTFVYLSSWAYPAPTSSIAGFAIDSSNGSLTPISGSPLNAGQGLGGILELSIP